MRRKDARENGRIVLAWGEVTGHHHDSDIYHVSRGKIVLYPPNLLSRRTDD